MPKNYQKIETNNDEDSTFLVNPIISAFYLQIETVLSAVLQEEAQLKNEDVTFMDDTNNLEKVDTKYIDKPFSGTVLITLMRLITSVAMNMSTSDKGIDDAVSKFDTFEEKLFMNVMEMFNIKCNYSDFCKFLLDLSDIAEVKLAVPDVNTMRKVIETKGYDIPDKLINLFSVDHHMIAEAAEGFVMSHFESLISGMTGGNVSIKKEENVPERTEEDSITKSGLRLVKPNEPIH